MESPLTHKAGSSFIVDLLSDTHTLSLHVLNPQCVGVAKGVNNKRVQGLTLTLVRRQIISGTFFTQLATAFRIAAILSHRASVVNPWLIKKKNDKYKITD